MSEDIVAPTDLDKTVRGLERWSEHQHHLDLHAAALGRRYDPETIKIGKSEGAGGHVALTLHVHGTIEQIEAVLGAAETAGVLQRRQRASPAARSEVPPREA